MLLWRYDPLVRGKPLKPPLYAIPHIQTKRKDVISLPRKRDNGVHIYLSGMEKQRLAEYAKKCNVSESGYFRRLLLGVVPKEFPPGDYAAILQCMRDIANDMQDITRVAKETGDIDSENIGRLMKAQYSLVRDLTKEAYDTTETPLDERRAIHGTD